MNKMRQNAVHVLLFACHGCNSVAHEQASLEAKIGAKTYGGEKDSGRLQVHLTALEAVKQTRYVS